MSTCLSLITAAKWNNTIALEVVSTDRFSPNAGLSGTGALQNGRRRLSLWGNDAIRSTESSPVIKGLYSTDC